jgi:hypothetical protein
MLCRENYGAIVTVTVGSGDEERSYFIYEGLLKHYSSYFRTALKKEWEEGATKTIELTDDEPGVFQIFFHWIFTGTLYSELSPGGEIPYDLMQLFKLFIFADARGIPELSNATIDGIFQVECQQWHYDVPSLQYIYDNTTPKSPLRRYMIDSATETFRFETIHDCLENYPKEFLADVITNIFANGYDSKFTSAKMGAMPYKFAKVKQLCQYHDHPKPESKP